MTTARDLLQQGIEALKAGRKAEARRLLTQVVQHNERNEMGWLWLSGAVDTDEDRRTCLENVLAINPNNGVARRGLETLLANKGVRPLSAISAPALETKSRTSGSARQALTTTYPEPKPGTAPSRTTEKREKTPPWKWVLLGGGGTVLLLLVGCVLAYVLGAIQLPSVSELRESGTATPTPNPVPALVETCLPTGYEYVSDYVTTGGGDTIWVVEVTEPEVQMALRGFPVFFREFAKTVDTSDVAWLKLSVVRSEAWRPYAHCVRSGPARAAARGEITVPDLFAQFDHCP